MRDSNAKHPVLNDEDSNQKTQLRDGSNTYLLRTAVIFLSIVSFFTTANGMREYIFRDNGVIAYTASAAIQGILLALSMNLPGYLRGIWSKKSKGFVKFLMCFMVILLTGVAVFCSSWFSYIYIAEEIHQDSWGTDSELLVQQTYRSQLYKARDYASTYRLYLEEVMGDHIGQLEEQARELLRDSALNFGIDWDTEEANYGSSGGTTASYMLPVIDAMRRVDVNEPSQEDQDQAARAVSDAQSNISQRMENIQQRTDTIASSLTNYNNQIANLTNRINSATEGTDVATLTDTLNIYTRMIDSATQEQAALEQESTQLDTALTRLSVYESFLGLNRSTSAITIRGSLLEMQSELFKQEPDEVRLLAIAQEIFQNLRNASNEQSTAENAQSYTTLLNQMNRLIRDLTDYSKIKDTELTLEDMITDLRSVTESIGLERSDSNQISETNLSDNVTDENQDTNTQWKKDWGKRLSDLKAQIGSMPIYTQSEGDILSDDQLHILRNYDRDDSSKELDEMIRRYIANHSAIYQGIIYLRSPYRNLAIFALILALSFDLAGFIFGFVIEGTGQYNHQAKGTARMGYYAEPKWSILKTLHQYYVLTGDYECKDGVYHYKAFRNGVLEDWIITDSEPYRQGIYRQDQKGAALHQQAVGQVEQKLRFADQQETTNPVTSEVPPKALEATSETETEKAQDGIYLGGQLLFNDGSLLRIKSDERHFLASVEEYVPIHCYAPHTGTNRTIPIKRLTKGVKIKIAVAALNQSGTRIAAIYAIEEAPCSV